MLKRTKGWPWVRAFFFSMGLGPKPSYPKLYPSKRGARHLTVAPPLCTRLWLLCVGHLPSTPQALKRRWKDFARTDSRVNPPLKQPMSDRLHLMALQPTEGWIWQDLPESRGKHEFRGFILGRGSSSLIFTLSLASTLPEAIRRRNRKSPFESLLNALMASSSEPNSSSSEPNSTLKEKVDLLEKELNRVRKVLCSHTRMLVKMDKEGERRFKLLDEDLNQLRTDINSSVEQQFQDQVVSREELENRVLKLEMQVDMLTLDWQIAKEEKQEAAVKEIPRNFN